MIDYLSFRPQITEQIAVPAIVRQIYLRQCAIEKALTGVGLGATQATIHRLLELIF
jgi:hypothetical protein